MGATYVPYRVPGDFLQVSARVEEAVIVIAALFSLRAKDVADFVETHAGSEHQGVLAAAPALHLAEFRQVDDGTRRRFPGGFIYSCVCVCSTRA